MEFLPPTTHHLLAWEHYFRSNLFINLMLKTSLWTFFRMCCNDWCSGFKHILIALHFHCHKNFFSPHEKRAFERKRRTDDKLGQLFLFPILPIQPFFTIYNFFGWNYFLFLQLQICLPWNIFITLLLNWMPKRFKKNKSPQCGERDR